MILPYTNDLKGITIHGRNINNFRYADDIALIANDKDNLLKIVDMVKVIGNRWRFRDKCKKEQDNNHVQKTRKQNVGDTR